MIRTNITIGLFGFGVVGQGLHAVLERTPGLRARIGRIAVKDRNKARSLPAELFTFDKQDLLDDPSLDVIVELIDNADEAYIIVKQALLNGKAVVTANKKMLAEHLPELIELQRSTGTPLLYEAAACASLPVIRNLEEYYDTDLLDSVEGIINGSTNYILTAMNRDGQPYADALAKAQRLGFAESNPALDVEGLDARNKLVLLLAHAFGLVTGPEELLAVGIDCLSPLATAYAREQGLAIKLVAEARRLPNGIIAAAVLPTLVAPSHELANVHDEFNGLVTQSGFADRQFFLGRGAGAFPTASAVLSDLSALTYGYRYEYKKIQQNAHLSLAPDAAEVDVLVTFEDEANVPDESDFTVVHEQLRSAQRGNYLIGTIGLGQLARATWLRLPGVCVVRLACPLRAASQAVGARPAIETELVNEISR
ncbi:homoserine dehydrogenase [Hymenobacter sp. HMF4947]|uniref:Homoserine dehydrogenase n=1 Tax=Hymenobacter ginkgonis TaxID=2682976 RepID=A0A7K1T9Z7_9BACT|nr:homoserine dehydrogenase [Hymenobacter ginkgonis]MVN75132.1 homoserine dehydrogenase [Hymenobacter ginkgonis]